MKFQEPKAEFVPIDLTNAITTVLSPGCDEVTSKRGSVETCTGSDSPSNNCCDGSSSFSV